MKLIELVLRNFKGIGNLRITPRGNNLNICGDNGTGKTTVFDGFMWLLFDKDSNNSSNFDIKTQDEDGQTISGLEHEVKGIIEVKGRVIELQKIYEEKWEKKRGETDQTLTGHKTKYFVDGVPKKKKEYTELLESIIDEETFRILTNPLYFNTNLDWKKRREVVMDLVEQVESEEVLKTNSKLKGLEKLLTEDMTAEDLKAKTTATKRKLNEEVKQIPVRIDEISRQDIDEDIVFSAVEESKKKLEKEIEVMKVGTIDTVKLEELKEEVAMSEAWKRTFERDKTQELNDQYKKVSKRIQEKQKSFNELEVKMLSIRNEIDINKGKVEFKTEELERLRNEYKELTSLEFYTDENTCKSCGQSLQENKKEENFNKFKEFKELNIQKNIEVGKRAKTEQESIALEIEGKEKEVRSLVGNMDVINGVLGEFRDNLTELEKQLESINFNEYPEYKENSLKIEEFNKNIESILTTSQNESQKQQDKLKELNEELSKANTLLSKKEVIETNLKRVEELKEEERDLADQIAQLEKLEIQCEQFVVTKAELLEERLNNKFKLVKFKLFETQINGGIKEVFTTTVNGVSFESNLNTAMKLNSGLDIINTLAEYYDFNAPIFLDNRESVNKIIDMDSQIINLIVSSDEKLTIEDEKTKGVA